MKCDSEQFTLGDLISALEKRDPAQFVTYDCGDAAPRGVHSYRGYYEDLAIGVDSSGSHCRVADLLQDLRGAVGQTFTGYKGGEYQMTRGTPLWVSNYGTAARTAIVGIEPDEYKTVLRTKHVSCP